MTSIDESDMDCHYFSVNKHLLKYTDTLYFNLHAHQLQGLMEREDETKYRENPKISDTRKFSVITLKVKQDGFSLE